MMVKEIFVPIFIMAFLYFIWVAFVGGSDFLGVAGILNGTMNFTSLMKEDVVPIELNQSNVCLNEYVEMYYSPEDAEELCKIRMRNG